MKGNNKTIQFSDLSEDDKIIAHFYTTIAFNEKFKKKSYNLDDFENDELKLNIRNKFIRAREYQMFLLKENIYYIWSTRTGKTDFVLDCI